MIQSQTRLVCADNTGVKYLGCIKVLGGSRRRYAGIGDIIVCSVKSATPTSKFKKGEVVKAIIVRQRFSFKKKCGSFVKFRENAAVIVTGKDIAGTRIFGPVCPCDEIRDKYPKILSLGGTV